MSEKQSEKSDMSAVEFTQYALRNHIAPPNMGSVKARVRLAARRLGWTHNRVRDAWYADGRISISADELRTIEEQTGLRYGREELRTIDELINRADALMDGPDADFYRPFLAAMRAAVRLVDRSRTEG